MTSILSKQQAVDEWLKIEFSKTAQKAELLKSNHTVSDELILGTLRTLDYLTSNAAIDDVPAVIGIVALMWEHVDRRTYDLRDAFVKFLARIGYSTSAIIVDDQYARDTCSFNGVSSIFDRLTIALNQRKYEISVCDHSFLLTQFQHDIWTAAEENSIIGVSAPTSAGKSFAIMLHTIHSVVQDRCDVVYIVPTLSLLNQVTSEYNKLLKEFDVANVSITNGWKSPSEDPTIYVFTQEKAMAVLSSDKSTFGKPLVLVIDEIQNIERMADNNDTRSKILYDTIEEFHHQSNVVQAFFTGPRISGLESLGYALFGENVKTVTTVVCPVLNLTYSIRKSGANYYLRQYSSLRETPYEEKIIQIDKVYPSGKAHYTDDYLEYLNSFVTKIGGEQQNIIFAPTSATARKIALSLKPASSIDESISELIDYYSSTISPDYAMCLALRNGTAYHHGKLPLHVRRTLEVALEKRLISNVVCTTTLMQGVNLPAQNVIIRNPHLYVRKQKHATELTNYEMANLRGRAGRLLKDFIGRTYVLDEGEFTNTDGFEQIRMFSEEEKMITPGYEEKYDVYKDAINDAVTSKETVSGDMVEYGYLVTYIRQSILRYGKSARNRMAGVGIKLDAKQVAAIIAKLEGLSVPKEICLKNRYWDPFVLDSIYKHYKGGVPNQPNERGAKARLDEMMKFLRDTAATRYMYERNIPQQYWRGKNRATLCTYAMQWAKGETLQSIFSADYFRGSEATDKIEDIIEVLQNTISYSLPLLLKPMFDIAKNDGAFITCLQSGASEPTARKMVEMGIPRETALELAGRIKVDSKSSDPFKLEKDIRCALKTSLDSLPFWIKVQIDFLIR